MVDETPGTAPATETPKTGFFAKLRNAPANIKENFTGSSTMNKGIRIVGGVASLGVMYDGAKRMLRGFGVVSPKLDDEGKEIPSGGGAVLGGLVEVTAAGAGLYYSLIHPGKGQGMSKA